MRHIKPYNQLFENTQELTQEQIDWLDDCVGGTWLVNPQTGLVDVEGFFDCGDQGLSDFKGVRFGSVKEYFACSYNRITSLEGAPQNVNDTFNCSHNRITSLEGGPQSVGKDFNCFGNQLTSLKGGPQSVGRYFNCSNNQLTSLEGAPQTVGGYLYCSGNPISEIAIAYVIGRMSDRNVSLEQAVSSRWKTGEWDEIPEADKPYLAKHNPDLTPEEKREYTALERLKKRII
jgi:hypothetical protein